MDWERAASMIGALAGAMVILGAVPAMLYHLRQVRASAREDARIKTEYDTQEARVKLEMAFRMEAVETKLDKHLEETADRWERFMALEKNIAVMIEANKAAAEHVRLFSQMAMETQKSVQTLVGALAKANGGDK